MPKWQRLVDSIKKHTLWLQYKIFFADQPKPGPPITISRIPHPISFPFVSSVCNFPSQTPTTIRPVRPKQRQSHFKRSRKNVKWRNGSAISPLRHFRHSTISAFRHPDLLIFRPHALRHLRIISITRSRSELVIAVPLGRHNPRSNKSSATFPPTTLAEYLCFPCGPLISDI